MWSILNDFFSFTRQKKWWFIPRSVRRRRRGRALVRSRLCWWHHLARDVAGIGFQCDWNLRRASFLGRAAWVAFLGFIITPVGLARTRCHSSVQPTPQLSGPRPGLAVRWTGLNERLA